VRVLFLGTPAFAVPTLQALLASRHQVAGVLTRRDAPAGRSARPISSAVKSAALDAGLPLLQPARVNSESTYAAIRALEPDVAVVVAFGCLLSPEFLTVPARGCVNLHASLLPAYRGAAPIQWAVVHGESETGVTTMLMDAGLDTGDMLLSARVPIGPEETASELAGRLAVLGAGVLVVTLGALEQGAVEPRPQPREGVSYAPSLARGDARIDWTWRSDRIAALVRGMQPWPVAHAETPRGPLQVWGASPRVEPGDRGDVAGEVLELRDRQVIVACGTESRLGLREVQPQGRRRMSAADAWNGRFLRAGDRLA
jgi:methionyl-tRNA formyltransferase